jgi:hypothetical protein
MSSPDSDIFSKILSESDMVIFKQHHDQYLREQEVLSVYTDRMQVIDKEREELLKAIKLQKEKLPKHIVNISNLLRKGIADYSEPRAVNYTDLHKIQHHNVELDIYKLHKYDPVLQKKEWKSKAFFDTLCALYPVFDDLGDNTFKKVSLTQAQFYWRSKMNDINEPPLKLPYGHSSNSTDL